MLKKTLMTLAALAIFAAGYMTVGCNSDDKKSKNEGLVDRMVDSVAVAVADGINKARKTSDTEVTEATPVKAEGIEEARFVADIVDLTLVDNNAYAVSDEGLIVYDLAKKSYDLIPSESRLRALTQHHGRIYTGGDELYVFEDDSLAPVEIPFTGVINELYSDGQNLYIGTTFGLWCETVIGTVKLLDEMDVREVVADNGGFWVGTAGQGLFRYDGDGFSKRYLARDPSLFDNVTALDFNHNHLYLGTPNGLYIFDGGSWQTVAIEDGLPSNDIRDVDASQWVIHVATANGVVTYFDNEVSPVDRLDTQGAETIAVRGRKIFLGTTVDGLLVKNGPVVTTLLKTLEEGDGSIASIEH